MAEPYVRPDVRQFLDYVNALPSQRAYELGLAEAREMMVRSRQVADAPTGELALIRDLAMPGPAGEIRMRLFDARASRDPGPLFLFFHGGGFVLGDLDTHEPFCAEMARELDMPVLAVDYRLAPEHPWPAGVEDAMAAARWAASSPEALERQVTGLVLCGDSAGGNFAIVTALALRDDPAAVPVLAQWPIYPAADPDKGYPSRQDFGEGYLLSEKSMDWFEECYRADSRDWRYAPLLKSQAGLPPTLVTTASLDPIRDQGRAYAAACVQAGVPTVFREAAGNIHGFINLRRAIPSAADDIRENVAALKLLLGQEGR
ncbi:alpha/beta hydrolase [Sphingosinicella terrae]|uniref:alpha/beta hydrolase n=1 Tax=Sphingosinicella terrae TaxID=2172047 RepID=UPI000E0D8F56|nr:alpha/beta hydrolase [Sphingosinicella terrae]